MLSNFTWWQFFSTFLLMCAIYYPFIFWLYYKPDHQLLYQRFSSGGDHQEEAKDANYTKDILVIPATESVPVTAVESDDVFVALENEVRSGVKAAKDAHADKAQVTSLLKNLLLKYPELKQQGEQLRVNELLIQLCGQAGYILYMAEAYALWPTSPDQQA